MLTSLSSSSPSPTYLFPPFISSLVIPPYQIWASLSLSPLTLSPSFSPTLHLLIHLSRYYSPTPPPCLSAAAAALPYLSDKMGSRPPSPQLPGTERGGSDPRVRPRPHRSVAAPVPLFASPSFSCCSAFSTCPRSATHGERRAGEAVAATTSPSPSPLRTTWPCPTFCVASASPWSWWETPARWR